MQTIKFPSIVNVAAILRDINAEAVETDDVDNSYIDVRLQVLPDAKGWYVRSGLSDYDQDHTGFWGAASVPGNGKRFNSRLVARDLIEQASDDYCSKKR